jgi:uncharacterized membrane protein
VTGAVGDGPPSNDAEHVEPGPAEGSAPQAPASKPRSHAEWFAARRAAAADAAAADAAAPSSTGLSPHTASILVYAAAWLSAVIFLILERDSRLVRFHALQATYAFGFLCLLAVGCGALTVLSAFWSRAAFQFFAIASEVAWVATVVIWLITLVCVARNAAWRMPVVARFADRRV